MTKLVILLLIPLSSSAEPGPLTSYLMAEPATLFDISMLRLKRLTDYWETQMVFNYKRGSQSKAISGNVNSEYDPDNDKIYIVLSAMDESSNETQMQAGCQNALKHIQIYVRKSLREIFTHEGQRHRSGSDELWSQSGSMIELRCYISGRSSSQGRFWARQLLADKEVTIERWPVK